MSLWLQLVLVLAVLWAFWGILSLVFDLITYWHEKARAASSPEVLSSHKERES